MEQKVDYTTRGKTIFRVEKNKDNPFVMIDRRPIENPCLSWRAKGVLTYLVSRPDNWIVRLGDLVKRSPEGVYAVRAALRELTKAGHITRREEREEGTGRFKQYVLEVHEIPITYPPTNLPQAAEPQAGNLTLNDTDSNETDPNKEIEEEVQARAETLRVFYESSVGPVTSLVMDKLEKAARDYPDQTWYLPAFETMKEFADHRSWSYVDKVLQGWKEHYFGWKPGDDRKRPGKKQTAAQSGDYNRYAEGEYAGHLA
jgi:hypothetical protein